MYRGARPRPRMPRRSPALLILGLLAIVLAGCSTRQVVLTGTVTDAYTGAPIPPASIETGDPTVSPDASGVCATPRSSQSDTLAVSGPNYDSASWRASRLPETA